MADPTIKELRVDLRRLSLEVEKLNKHRFVRMHNSIPKLLYYRFLSGLAVGLGTVLGGTLLLSLIILALSSIDFIPVIGDWAARIAERVAESIE